MLGLRLWMVFEWNTSEAEFELEFVSPDKRSYSFDHSLVANNELIIDEKRIGYTSKMFEIEDLGKGDWLINLIYKIQILCLMQVVVLV